jgi:hypothetical protein
VAKFEVEFEDYEGSQYEEYQGEDPRPGWYTAETVRLRDADDQLVAFLQIVDHEDYAGWTRGWYMGEKGSSTYWKAQDYMKAVQGGAEKPIALDPEKEASVAAFLKKAKRVKIQVGEYNDNMTIRKVRPLLNAVAGTGASKATSPKAAPAPEPEVEEDALEDYTTEELNELKVADLEEIITDEFEADLPDKPTGRGAAVKYKKALVETILEMQSEDSEEEGDDEPAEEGDDEFEDGFDEETAEEPEEEPEPEPAPRARRSRTAAPAKAAPAKAAATTRRRRG